MNPELLVPLKEQLGIGPVGPRMWQNHEVLTVPLLKTVLERRPIHFGEDSWRDLYSAVGSDAKQMRVVSGVMQFAQGHAVVDRWHPKLVCVRDDVGSVKKLNVALGTRAGRTNQRRSETIAVCGLYGHT